MPETTGTLAFRVDARHIRQLGRELVADRVTAVSELIKNAYDADASDVTVVFSRNSRAAKGGHLTITDDGSGMTLEDLREKWMVVSTASKTADAISPLYARTRAGQKGIGRFATESLGSRLVLSATIAGSSERVIVEFDWFRGYEAGLALGEVLNPYRVESAPEDEHGTELRIEGLHDRWDREMIRRIRDAVFMLQPPFRVADSGVLPERRAVDPGFRVAVTYDDETDRPGDAEGFELVADAATAIVEGVIDARGVATRRVYSKHLGIDISETLDKPVLLTGPLEFSAAYFVFRRDALNPDASLGVRKARALSERFGGIRLYRDGLRVMPYGEAENDWLGLDAIYRKRGSVLAPIGNKNFFGEVLIGRDENPLLIDTASREGLLENEALDELQGFLVNAAVWSVAKVEAARRAERQTPEPEPEPTPRADLVEELVGVVRELGQDSSGSDGDRWAAVLSVLDSLELRARASDDAAERQRQELLGELELMRVLASVGGSIAIFSHEVRTVLVHATAAVEGLADAAGKHGLSTAELELRAAEEELAGLSDLAAYLELYVSHSRRRGRRPLPLHAVLNDFAKSVEHLVARRGVALRVDVEPNHLRTRPMSRSELESVLVNFLTNALKAMDREGLQERQLEISARQEGTMAVLRFCDTGVGINDLVRENLFDAFITTTEATDAELGAGTGLGLKIVADIARANGGIVAVGEAHAPFVTCIEFRVPTSGEAEAGDGAS